jgi:hypothetical protein
MVYFIFIGASTAVYAIRKETGAAKAILTVAGVLNILVFGFVGYEFIANPTVWGLQPLTYGYIVFSFILGAAIYLGSKAYHKSRGVDISIAYKELPPE